MTIETKERTGVGLGRGGRMSRKRKRDAVLRMLRGEDLDVEPQQVVLGKSEAADGRF